MLRYGYRNYAVKTAAQVQKPKVLCTGFAVTRKYAYISSESIAANIVGGGEGGAVVCVQALVNLEPHPSIHPPMYHYLFCYLCFMTHFATQHRIGR
jgi:hypothetical protein